MLSEMPKVVPGEAVPNGRGRTRSPDENEGVDDAGVLTEEEYNVEEATSSLLNPESPPGASTSRATSSPNAASVKDCGITNTARRPVGRTSSPCNRRKSGPPAWAAAAQRWQTREATCSSTPPPCAEFPLGVGASGSRDLGRLSSSAAFHYLLPLGMTVVPHGPD